MWHYFTKDDQSWSFDRWLSVYGPQWDNTETKSKYHHDMEFGMSYQLLKQPVLFDGNVWGMLGPSTRKFDSPG